jgi:hypothetical protein
MSAGCYSPLWRRILNRVAPFLFSTCPAYNKHWRTDIWCFCVAGTNGAILATKHRGEWLTAKSDGHGGIAWESRAPWENKRRGVAGTEKEK